MSDREIDPAVKIADEFKKRGFFDEAKNSILAQPISDVEPTTLEQFIRERVSSTVAAMVRGDESLIFKNRGSTSALIEGQLVKDGYEKLNTSTVKIDSTLRRALEDPEFKSRVISQLRSETEVDDDQQASQ